MTEQKLDTKTLSVVSECLGEALRKPGSHDAGADALEALNDFQINLVNLILKADGVEP